MDAAAADFLRDAETIMCPFCWPDDAARINFRLRRFICAHCGTDEVFAKFHDSLTERTQARVGRVMDDLTLLTRVLNAELDSVRCDA